MAFAIIILLYISVGIMSVAGSIYLVQRFVPTRYESLLFGLFLIPIAGFYLAFTAYFENQAAWNLELTAVAVFTVLACLGTRLPLLLVAGYLLHGIWDFMHELQAHLGVDTFGGMEATAIPLAYGAFCATYDVCMAAYFYLRRDVWKQAWAAAS